MTSAALAQGVDVPAVRYPRLPMQGAAIEKFVPPGWRMETQVQGDLNRDGVTDQVLVLHEDDPENLVSHEGLGENPLNSNPRILAVLFGRSGGGYALAAQNHTLIPRRTNTVMEYPLNGIVDGGVTIKHGTLQVGLGRFFSVGSSEMGSSTFTFRWQDGDFRLIGYDSMSVVRNTGAIEKLSIDYVTGQVKHSHGTTYSDEETVSWTELNAAPLLRLDEVGDGLAFDPENRSSRSSMPSLSP